MLLTKPYFSPCSFERSVSTCFATEYLRWFKSEHSDFLSHGWLAVVVLLGIGFPSRLPFPASILRLWFPKLGVAIAVTLYSLISQFVYDLEFPALLRFLQASGHINSYGDGQVCYPYVQPRGWNPHQAVISGIATLFHAWTSRTIISILHSNFQQ